MNRHNIPYLPLGIVASLALISGGFFPEPIEIFITLISAGTLGLCVIYYFGIFMPTNEHDHPPQWRTRVEDAKNDLLMEVALMMAGKDCIKPSQGAMLRQGRGGYYIALDNGKTCEVLDYILEEGKRIVKDKHTLNGPQMRLLTVLLDKPSFHTLPVLSAHEVMRAKIKLADLYMRHAKTRQNPR